MSKKPILKQEVKIDRVMKNEGFIGFFASLDAKLEFEEFGRILKDPTRTNYYLLIIDGRYDFDEVIEYIKTFEGQDTHNAK